MTVVRAAHRSAGRDSFVPQLLDGADDETGASSSVYSGTPRPAMML
jgi:hypothetical protein